MLIKNTEIIKILNSNSIKITGVLHLGAHECEELPFYNEIGVSNENIVWIEAINEKVNQAVNRGILNVYNAVITDKDNDDIVFNVSNNCQSSSVLELGTHLEEHPEIYYVNKIEAKSITINSFFEKNKIDGSKLNFWNFDIQGAELLALKGASNYIKYAKAIYLEVNEKELYLNCGLIKDIDLFLEKYNFKRVITNMTQHGWGDALYIIENNMNEKLNKIQTYLNSGNNKDCYELCEKVLYNIENSSADCDPYIYIQILFSYYVSSFYHNYNESVKIIDHIYDVCNKNPNIKLEFDKNKDFYESQFKYCKDFKPKNSDTISLDNKYYVTFNHNGGRTGNILFQYLICKLISIKFGHTYICKTNFTKKNFILINEEGFDKFLDNPPENICQNNIIIEGFFQKSDYFMKYRDILLEIFYNQNNDDYWIINNNKTYVKEFINCNHSIRLNDNDIVLSIRLDDFIQMPHNTSDIIPPTKIMEILSSFNMDNRKLYIVCDKIKVDWEFKYIKYFYKYNPILIQNTLLHDCALMRECKILIHSNSTLCWFMSFLSKNKTKRIILNTNFYKNQVLKRIQDFDDLIDVKPLLHSEIFNLYINYSNIFSLPYCISDECIVESIPEKHKFCAELIPGDVSTYVFNSTQEKEYNNMYRNAKFAITKLKGGWDCLRHYEILSNGCIPVFEEISNCPSQTLISFPKELIIKSNDLFTNWKNTSEDIINYENISFKLLEHTKNNCSSSANTKYFFDKIKNNVNNNEIKNVLLLTCHSGVNYTRETLWIGIKRQLQSLGGVAIEYPKIDFLYDDYQKPTTNLYGNGFTYTKRLKNDYNFNEIEIIEKIQNNFWDLIIFGKVGPDELFEGTIPNLPLWNIIKNNYNRDKIVFLYGGDGQQNMKENNKYSNHLLYHSLFGTCFVRELNI